VPETEVLSSNSDQATSKQPSSTIIILIISIIAVILLQLSAGVYYFFGRSRSNIGEQDPSAALATKDTIRKKALSIRFTNSEEVDAFDTANQIFWEGDQFDQTTMMTSRNSAAYHTSKSSSSSSSSSFVFNPPSDSVHGLPAPSASAPVVLSPFQQHAEKESFYAHSSVASSWFGSNASIDKEANQVSEIASINHGGLKPFFDRVSNLKRSLLGTSLKNGRQSSIGSLSKFV
jgi:hypothetical protein